MNVSFKKFIICVVTLTIVIIMAATGCAKKAETPAADTGTTTAPSSMRDTDYKDINNWLSLPESAPKPVDIFYLYPTAWQKENPDDANICEIDNKSMRERAPAVFLVQASAYETEGNVFAPYYRQADAVYTLSLPVEEQVKITSGIPKTDVLAAFDYYIKNLNGGRPYVLAGHSQGSNMMLFILSEYMRDNPEVYEQMVAAYVIGYSVTDDFLAENPHLNFAESKTDTGVIVSWNTEAAGIDTPNPVILPGANVINPLIWTRTEEKAGAKLNLGCIERTDTGIIKVPGFADAQINLERGTLMCSTVNPDSYNTGLQIFPRGIFHGQDYDFYYYNLRQNTRDRIQAFLNKP